MGLVIEKKSIFVIRSIGIALIKYVNEGHLKKTNFRLMVLIWYCVQKVKFGQYHWSASFAIKSNKLIRCEKHQHKSCSYLHSVLYILFVSILLIFRITLLFTKSHSITVKSDYCLIKKYIISITLYHSISWIIFLKLNRLVIIILQP